MKQKELFDSNNIDEVVNRIQEKVEKGETLFILFPFYYPPLGLNAKYDVVGLPENQMKIAESLKEREVRYLHIASTFFVFFPNSLSEMEQEEIKREAFSMAHMYDLID